MKAPLRIGALVAWLLVGSGYAYADPLTDSQKSVMDTVTPSQGYRYFSGYWEPLHNHPAIYASNAGDGDVLTVIGNGYYKEFPIGEADRAFEAYRTLLRKRGYEAPYAGGGDVTPEGNSGGSNGPGYFN